MYLAGSSDFISKWLTDESNQPVEFPIGLMRSVFDNEQLIAKKNKKKKKKKKKTYKVKADNKVPTSVITSHIHFYRQ